MKSNILKVLSQTASEETVIIELIAENKDEKILIESKDQTIEDYLIFNLDAIEIIKDSTPQFIIRRVKKVVGFGN